MSRRLHWPRTLIKKGSQSLSRPHLCYQAYQPSADRLYCLLLDCSGSMLKQNRLGVAKGVIQQLSQQIYQQRGQMAVIGFRAEGATILKAPGKLSSFNDHWIDAIPGGGGTPLTMGIRRAEQLMQTYQSRSSGLTMDCWLLTDGRFAELPPAPQGASHYVVIDFEAGKLRLARAKRLAQAWRADYFTLTDLVPG